MQKLIECIRGHINGETDYAKLQEERAYQFVRSQAEIAHHEIMRDIETDRMTSLREANMYVALIHLMKLAGATIQV